MVTKADEIRALGNQGVRPADIAASLGISISTRTSCSKKSGLLQPRGSGSMPLGDGSAPRPAAAKPLLSVDKLVDGGFALSSRWVLTEKGDLTLERPVENAVGVYAFATEATVMYVGVATMGFARRLYFYGKPAPGQLTNQRLNQLIKTELTTRPFLDVYTAVPGDFEWNGRPVHGAAGLELGLIKTDHSHGTYEAQADLSEQNIHRALTAVDHDVPNRVPLSELCSLQKHTIEPRNLNKAVIPSEVEESSLRFVPPS